MDFHISNMKNILCVSRGYFIKLKPFIFGECQYSTTRPLLTFCFIRFKCWVGLDCLNKINGYVFISLHFSNRNENTHLQLLQSIVCICQKQNTIIERNNPEISPFFFSSPSLLPIQSKIHISIFFSNPFFKHKICSNNTTSAIYFHVTFNNIKSLYEVDLPPQLCTHI